MSASKRARTTSNAPDAPEGQQDFIKGWPNADLLTNPELVSGLKESRSKQHSLDKPRDPADILMDTQVRCPENSANCELKRAVTCAGVRCKSWLREEQFGL